MVKTSEGEMMRIENEFYEQGYSIIAGVDEAGCGPLAGPVVACAVILPKGYFNSLIYDSKKVSPKLRRELYGVISENAIDIGIGVASNDEIDKFNVRGATKLAMIRALLELEVKPDVVLVDGNFFDVNFWMLNHDGKKVVIKNIIKGDRKSISIASASIIAKVLRDNFMEHYDEIYPGYNFSKHKGYPTEEHLSAIKRFGVTEIHRKTYKPIQKFLKALKQSRLFDEEK
ncbi:ribonuclease HII [Candidatus Kryptobacter tengchongensis]|uniref:ribonuclease HII n=1 Tax=Kryptobacter tengchongensis TaxID=1643429 RepID=UPI000708487E|nr:ribonuclease HII [Candidatus Kryptobacter tengchongensis]CUS90818.1 RNase HII [Candidatus Kryptobacter tengchongensis]CUS96650.1 RNase HII [Candidatus Kryptobacter tengchongensis]